jgi:predicted transcriptional regulator
MACGVSRRLTVARTAGGPHQLTAKIFSLSDQGYSQRQIAAETRLSQSTVQRILAGPRPDTPSDPDGILAEFEELAKQAEAENTLAAYRRVHETAKICHGNGYDVRWHSLPYLMILSAAEQEASTARERNSLRAEAMMVYQDMREWRERNA